MNLTDLQQFLTSFQENLDAKFGANASKDVDVLMNMTKITEEVGELAEQIMKYQGRQRDAKGDFDLTDLKDEVADVIIAASMMAVALDLDLDEVVQKKITKIKDKRWM